MNPLPLALGELRRHKGGAFAVVAVIALAVALGVAIVAQERALRESATRAAGEFDLVLGAPGNPTQLVLTTIYLQPAALDLLPADAWGRVARTPGVAGVAPVAVTDSYAGYTVVGTGDGLLAAAALSEGRIPSGAGEAMVGSDVELALGARFRPQHGTPSENLLESHEHDASLTVVGRLAPRGTPWDRAIVVPMVAVAAMHDAHAGDRRVAPVQAMRVPALVVKPASVADAYRLRSEFRALGWLALFPAEVLLPMYRLLGNVRDLFAWTALAYQALVAAAVLLVVLAVLASRRQSLGVLRALGAPPSYLFLVVWVQCLVLIGTGIAAGALMGTAACYAIASMIHARTGLAIGFPLGWPEWRALGALLAAGSVFATIPSLLALRIPAVRLLRAA